MRYQNSVHFSSVTVKHRTPRTLLADLEAEFHFNLDPCPIAWTPEEPSGLELDWRGRRVFCNPPYGKGVSDWLRKGPDAHVAVFLLPARTDTIWFHTLVLPLATEVRFLQGRLRFGDGRGRAPFPSMIVVFRNYLVKEAMALDEDYWNFVEKTADEVDKWPAWLKGK